MSGLEPLVVLAAGLVAGFLTPTVGVASLVSFPALLAVGLPPVVANVSNTIGMTPAGVSGSFGYRSELSAHPRAAAVVLATGMVGSVAGAVLLLGLPPGVFESVVPYLILVTCLLVGAQPTITRVLRRGREPAAPRQHLSPVTTAFSVLVGVYGGYFGAGSGVMMVAVLGFGTDLLLPVVNALKTLSVLASNVVASVIFVLVADPDWAAVGLLAVGSLIGGYVGARVGRRLPPTLFRVLIVAAGLTAATTMLAG